MTQRILYSILCKAGNKLSTYTSNSHGSFFVACFIQQWIAICAAFVLTSQLQDFKGIFMTSFLHFKDSGHVQDDKTQEYLWLLKSKISPSQCCVFKIQHFLTCAISCPENSLYCHPGTKPCSWTLDMAYASLNWFILKQFFKQFYWVTLYCAGKAIPFPSLPFILNLLYVEIS